MEMHKAYGGNAKAMSSLCGEVVADFAGDLASFWGIYRHDLLANPELKSLIAGQFERLEKVNPLAYKLLCRMGCYRYQDVPKVSREALLALMWDFEESQKHKSIRFLKQRKLIEFSSEEFWLHPVIQAESRSYLEADFNQWHQVNMQAAGYWVQFIEKVLDVVDAKSALEAYYHYCIAGEYELALEVMIKRRKNAWGRDKSFGSDLWKLGLFTEVRETCQHLAVILPDHPMIYQLYNLIGESYWMSGNPRKGIYFHTECLSLLTKSPVGSVEQNYKIVEYLNLSLCCFDLWNLSGCLQNLEEGLRESSLFPVNNHKPIIQVFKVAVISELLICEKSKKINLKDVLDILVNAQELHKSNESESTIWGRTYFLLFSGRFMMNLKDYIQGISLLREALNFAVDSSFVQGQAKAQSLLGEVYRNRDNDRSLEYQKTAIRTLDKISAICDLAEAYFFQALTYRDMGNSVKAQESLDRAQELYRSFDAPLQIERTNKAFYQP